MGGRGGVRGDSLHPANDFVVAKILHFVVFHPHRFQKRARPGLDDITITPPPPRPNVNAWTPLDKQAPFM